MSAIATFNYYKNIRTVVIDFYNPTFDPKQIRQSLKDFKDKLQDIGESQEYDFVVIKPETGVKTGKGLHSYFLEELDVKEISTWEKIVLYIERMHKVTIIALPESVNDTIFQLALVCDYCFCLPTTKFKFSAIKSGFLPGMAVFRLAKYVGLGLAKKMLFKGTVINARRALRIGIVEEIVDDLDQCAKDIINKTTPQQIEAIIMSRLILCDSYHDSYEEEIGSYLSAQVRCMDNLKKIKAVLKIQQLQNN